VPRLYDRVVEIRRIRHDSRRTKAAYLHWIRPLLLLRKGTYWRHLAGSNLNRFPTHLAVRENVTASARNRALPAVLFLYDGCWSGESCEAVSRNDCRLC
jgi:hypothetical protein